MLVNMSVERLLKRKKITGDIQPLRQGGSQKSELNRYSSQLCELVEKYPDSTLSEYCEYWGNIYGQCPLLFTASLKGRVGGHSRQKG
jgi:transposase